MHLSNVIQSDISYERQLFECDVTAECLLGFLEVLAVKTVMHMHNKVQCQVCNISIVKYFFIVIL